MCFCASVSFTASAGLAVIGTATMVWRSRPEERFVTATPLWFAGQQAIEGFLWLNLTAPAADPAAVQSLTTAYLAFALFWWPGYTAFGAWWMERVPWRRRALASLAIAGTVVGTFLFGVYLLDPAPARIVQDSISHHMARPGVPLFTGLYITVALAVGLFTSSPRLKLFYALFALSTLVALYWYRHSFTSVWCYFAAGLSALLWFNPSRSPASRPA